MPAFVLYPEGISIPVSCTEMYTKNPVKQEAMNLQTVKDEYKCLNSEQGIPAML